ncbi:MAG: carbon-nitrogen hydrolase family protein [Burkholderiales bacterium]
MKIAALQMVSTPDLSHNLETAHRLAADAARQGARLVALPEYFGLMGSKESDKLQVAEFPGEGPIQNALSDMARRHDLWVVGGTLPLKCNEPDKVLNACCVYRPDGTLAVRYDKLHLFQFDNGREAYDEGVFLKAGNQPVTFEATIDGHTLRMGFSVCYDLRFPELYRAMMSPPCDLICVPSAFTYTTGQAHWEILLRARAIENQCHVIAPAQGGFHENNRRTWGHSMVISPWGEVLSLVPEGEGMALAELSLESATTIRQQLPALSHRRLGGLP